MLHTFVVDTAGYPKIFQTVDKINNFSTILYKAGSKLYSYKRHVSKKLHVCYVKYKSNVASQKYNNKRAYKGLTESRPVQRPMSSGCSGNIIYWSFLNQL